MNPNYKKIINFILIFTILILINSCTNQNNFTLNEKENPASNEKTTLRDYFHNNENLKIYRRIISQNEICIKGNCPKKQNINNYYVLYNCDSCSNAEIKENQIIINSLPITWSDFNTECSKSNQFFIPKILNIEFKNQTTIIAKGEGHGFEQKKGNCKPNNYFLNISTEEEWLFTTEDIKINVDVKSSSQDNLIKASAINYDKNEVDFSKDYLEINCSSNNKFRLKPWIELIEVDGLNITKSQNLLKIKKSSDDFYKNPEKFYFNSIFNGKFKIKAICRVYGGKGDIIYTKKDPNIYTIEVYNSDSGNVDKEWILNNN